MGKFLIISIIIFQLYTTLSWANEYVALISEKSGSVHIRDKKNVIYGEAKKGSRLAIGSWIKTGNDGWALLTFVDGSKLTIANNSELEITEFLISKKTKKGVFSMMQGKLRASIVKMSQDKVDFKIKSPTAVAGVKGTEFMMMTRGEANVFFGNEGVVEIYGQLEQGKFLTYDTMVQNTRGLTPTDPVKVEPNTPLETAKKYFSEITSAKPPKDWEISDSLPHIIARWNINYGHYLADSGRYEEALYVFQIALDLTDNPEIRSDARLERGAVYSRFLKNAESALAEYLLILEEYPNVPQRETALYLTAMTLYELKFFDSAKERLLQYKKEFPEGRYIGNVDTILKLLK
ncbi:MAG: FecR domain-containing protein [Proteobacteria bacterium]|nr:FecR domain-containing protein [Pseudomonadota bacterium]